MSTSSSIDFRIPSVHSLGTVGLAVVDACKISGATRIIGVDTDQRKEKVAKEFGVTDFLNLSLLPKSMTVQQQIIAMTNGTGNRDGSRIHFIEVVANLPCF